MPPSHTRANQNAKTPNKHLNLHHCVGRRPGDFDAVLGRGGESNHHLGTKMFRDMVDSRKYDYVMATTNQQKYDIVMSCLACLKARGGRIVGKWKGLYYEASEQKQYSKVIQRMRERNMVMAEEMPWNHMGVEDAFVCDDIVTAWPDRNDNRSDTTHSIEQLQCLPMSAKTFADEDVRGDTTSGWLWDSFSNSSFNGLDLGIPPVLFHDVFDYGKCWERNVASG